MSNPAYLWLTDTNGSPITGSSLVTGRIGAIELKAVTHHLSIPVDGNTEINRNQSTYTYYGTERF